MNVWSETLSVSIIRSRELWTCSIGKLESIQPKWKQKDGQRMLLPMHLILAELMQVQFFKKVHGKKIKYMWFGKTSCGSPYLDKVWTSSEWGKMRNIESLKPTANNWSDQHHNWCYTCIEEIRGKEESKKLKNSLAKVKKECKKWK